MTHIKFNLTTTDHLKLYVQGWLPKTTPPTAIICLIHGLGEHSGRYAHVASHLTATGLALIALDLRGHGHSTGPRGHAPTYEAMMEDIALFLSAIEQRYPDLPKFLYGHSLGGNLVINYALRYHPTLAGMIATAPALRPAFSPPKVKIWLGKILYPWWPSLLLPAGLDLSALSRNTQVRQDYQRDPLTHGRISIRFGLDILATGEWALQHAEELKIPLLLMHGDADRLTSMAASREFAQRAGKLCTLTIWKGLYHELHQEPEQEAVLTHLVQWLHGNG